MKEYIEREAAIFEFETNGSNFVYGKKACNAIISRLKTIPAADVAAVRHGRWIWDDDGMDWGIGAWKCSECHCKPETLWEACKGNPRRYSGSHYCPNCGAKMDGGADNG